MHLLSPGFGDVPFAGFGIVFIVIAVVSVVVIIGVVVLIVLVVARNARKVRQAGYDPLTLNAELATRVLDSSVLQPTQTIEQRLAEVEDLRARGVISAEEREKARAEILRS